jgi:hypothetical protein
MFVEVVVPVLQFVVLFTKLFNNFFFVTAEKVWLNLITCNCGGRGRSKIIWRHKVTNTDTRKQTIVPTCWLEYTETKIIVFSIVSLATVKSDTLPVTFKCRDLSHVCHSFSSIPFYWSFSLHRMSSFISSSSPIRPSFNRSSPFTWSILPFSEI